jgi:hypothetical protein
VSGAGAAGFAGRASPCQAEAMISSEFGKVAARDRW